MGQVFLRPDADQSDGSWLNEASSGTNLFASVDETSAGDSDYIQSSSVIGDKVRLRLSDPGTTVAQPFIIRYRAKRAIGNASAGIIGRLFQGTTQIATWNQVVTDTLTTYTYTLTSGEFSAISDFNDLFVEFEYAYLWWLANAAVDLSLAQSLYYDSAAGGTGQAVATYLSCSRASNGYAKTAAGTLTSFGSNALRITDLGLLSEEARTNLLHNSQTFEADWETGFMAPATSTTESAPDGTATAQKFNPESGVPNNNHVSTNFNPSFTSGVNNVWSIYAKRTQGANSWVRLHREYNFASKTLDQWFNLNTGAQGTLVNTGASWTSPFSGMEQLADNWWRIWLGGVPGLTDNGPDSIVLTDVGSGSISTTAAAEVTLWGAQAEDIPTGVVVPSSYIPTTVSSVTRAADNITITGNAQTDIAAATASIVAQVDNTGTLGLAANVVDSNGTNLLGFNSSNNALASITATLATGNTANRTTQDKLGLAWSGAGRSLVLNGGTVASDASAQTPSSTQHVGSNGTSNFVNGYIERLTIWTTKLANATLQGFTT